MYHYATLHGTPGRAVHVPAGWLFIWDDGRTLIIERAALVLLGQVDLATAQHEHDGNLAAKVCGY